MEERADSEIQRMRELSSPAFQVDDFASRDEIATLLAAFADDGDREKKSTGPVCSHYRGLGSLDSRIEQLIGPHRILSMSNIFATGVPHGLHSDAPKDMETTPYKAILIPLAYHPPENRKPFDLSFFTFNQRWYGFPAKFYKGERDIYSPHNRPVYDYSEIAGLDSSRSIDPTIHSRWLSHLKPIWLEGLTIEKQFDWTIGSAIVFDAFQIHCSSDFRAAGVKMKIGLSIFTEKNGPL